MKNGKTISAYELKDAITVIANLIKTESFDILFIHTTETIKHTIPPITQIGMNDRHGDRFTFALAFPDIIFRIAATKTEILVAIVTPKTPMNLERIILNAMLISIAIQQFIIGCFVS